MNKSSRIKIIINIKNWAIVRGSSVFFINTNKVEIYFGEYWNHFWAQFVSGAMIKILLCNES